MALLQIPPVSEGRVPITITLSQLSRTDVWPMICLLDWIEHRNPGEMGALACALEQLALSISEDFPWARYDETFGTWPRESRTAAQRLRELAELIDPDRRDDDDSADEGAVEG